MKVVVNKPAPAPLPPTTVDLTGLTEDEFKILKYALGRTNTDDAKLAGCGDHYAGYNLFDKFTGVKL